jgi:hypothetical protein
MLLFAITIVLTAAASLAADALYVRLTASQRAERSRMAGEWMEREEMARRMLGV